MLTDQQHPITPPPELVQQWRNAAPPFGLNRETWIATQAARWGADQQLNADCEWLYRRCLISGAEELRAAMRPKPPSLAEQALAAIEGDFNTVGDRADISRRALERLKELEELEEGNG